MGNAWLVARHEFSVTVARGSYRVFAGIVPAIAILGLLGIAVWQNVSSGKPQEQIDAGVVDLTMGPDGKPLFTSFLDDDPTVKFHLVSDVETGKQELLDGTLDKLYVIPADYVQSGNVVEIKEEQAGLGDLGSSGGGNPNVTPLGRFLLNNLFVGEVGSKSERVLRPFTLVTTQIDKSGNVVENPVDTGRLLVFMGAAILLIISILTTSGYLLQGLNEEKENRIMEVLLSSVKPEHLMVGKLFGLGAAGILQMLIWTASGAAFTAGLLALTDLGSGINLSFPPLAIIAALAYFVLGYFFFGTLMAALGAVTTSQREAQQVTFLVVLPGVAPMWFLTQMIQNPEGTLARVASFIPFSAPVSSLVRLGVDGMGALDLVISLGLLIAGVAAVMWMTARLFRAYLLMFGQRPSIRQIFRTLRNA